jgi:DNA-binding NarL/FixJ family response regulator
MAKSAAIHRTKVLIADDHLVVRRGLTSLLSAREDLEVIGEAEDGEQAVQLARNRRPDVVLMDVVMPVCNGDVATRRILRLQPNCKILALSSYSDGQSVEQMLEAGAVGYLTKRFAADQLLEAIQTVTTGNRCFFSPDVTATAEWVRKVYSAGNNRGRLVTTCESEVLKLVATGVTNKSIAARLKISMGTVRYCRENVMEKLKLRGIAELTQYAIANGLVPLGDSFPRQAVNGTSRARLLNGCGKAGNGHQNGEVRLAGQPAYNRRLANVMDASVHQDNMAFNLRNAPPNLQKSAPGLKQSSYWACITPREYEVAIAISEGLTNKQIAARLNLGVRTIETHREKLFRKLEIYSVAGLTKFLLARGLIAA